MWHALMGWLSARVEAVEGGLAVGVDVAGGSMLILATSSYSLVN